MPFAVPAQWLNYKTPGVPRTPDGKPNLSAPAPRMPDGRPDFSGLSADDPAGRADMSKAMDSVKPLPWAAAVSDERRENLFRDDPRVACLPDYWPGKVLQTRNLLLMPGSGTLYREVFLDGRELPKAPNPDWLGYSTGHWDGETLVIESNGFNDRTWIDYVGHPHTETLHLTERWRRPDYGHLEVIATYVDPGALREPWTVPLKYELDADTQPLEYVCNENERDRVHLVGRASDNWKKTVEVSPGILSRYAGAYEFRNDEGRLIRFTVGVEGDHLVLGGSGASTPYKPTSQTEFAGIDSSLKFAINEAGAVTTVTIQDVEGELKAVPSLIDPAREADRPRGIPK